MVPARPLPAVWPGPRTPHYKRTGTARLRGCHARSQHPCWGGGLGVKNPDPQAPLLPSPEAVGRSLISSEPQCLERHPTSTTQLSQGTWSCSSGQPEGHRASITAQSNGGARAPRQLRGLGPVLRALTSKSLSPSVLPPSGPPGKTRRAKCWHSRDTLTLVQQAQGCVGPGLRAQEGSRAPGQPHPPAGQAVPLPPLASQSWPTSLEKCQDGCREEALSARSGPGAPAAPTGLTPLSKVAPSKGACVAGGLRAERHRLRRDRRWSGGYLQLKEGFGGQRWRGGAGGGSHGRPQPGHQLLVPLL